MPKVEFIGDRETVGLSYVWKVVVNGSPVRVAIGVGSVAEVTNKGSDEDVLAKLIKAYFNEISLDSDVEVYEIDAHTASELLKRLQA